MAITMGQALAERIRHQVESGQQVLESAGDRSDAVFGSPKDVLTVCGNVADVAHTNHLWLLDLVQAGVGSRDLPAELRRDRPGSVQEAVQFLGPRETDCADEALSLLDRVNEAIASRVEGLSDEELEAPVEITFYGRKTARDLLFAVIEHGSLHIGQAWGILKGAGIGR